MGCLGVESLLLSANFLPSFRARLWPLAPPPHFPESSPVPEAHLLRRPGATQPHLLGPDSCSSRLKPQRVHKPSHVSASVRPAFQLENTTCPSRLSPNATPTPKAALLFPGSHPPFPIHSCEAGLSLWLGALGRKSWDSSLGPRSWRCRVPSSLGWPGRLAGGSTGRGAGPGAAVREPGNRAASASLGMGHEATRHLQQPLWAVSAATPPFVVPALCSWLPPPPRPRARTPWGAARPWQWASR